MSSESGWRKDTAEFLRPNREIDAASQLEFMRDFRAEFGERVMKQSRKDMLALSRAAEANPSFRIVPTRLEEQVTNRQQLVIPKTGSSLEDFMDGHNKLWTPMDAEVNQYWRYLWGGYESIYESNSIFLTKEEREQGMANSQARFSLRYKTPDNRLVARQSYLENLLRSGTARETRAGKLWTFPIMQVTDIQSDRRGIEKSPADLFERLHYLMSPEARLGMQVLNVVAGSHIDQDVVEITNEVMAEVDANGKPLRHVGTAHVTRKEKDPNKFKDTSFFRFHWISMHAMLDFKLPLGVDGLATWPQQPAKPSDTAPKIAAK